jgi:hypothetical protein
MGQGGVDRASPLGRAALLARLTPTEVEGSRTKRFPATSWTGPNAPRSEPKTAGPVGQVASPPLSFAEAAQSEQVDSITCLAARGGSCLTQ